MNLDDLMRQYMSGPSAADQDAVKRQAIMAASLGLLASAPVAGKGWGGAARALGQGGLLGMNAYAQGMQGLNDANRGKLSDMSMLMDFQTKKQAYDDDQSSREVLSNFQMPAPLPSMSPTNANAAALSAAPKTGPYEQLMARADALEAKGLARQAQQYRTMAEKYAPSFDTTPRVGTKDGKRIKYVLDKQGNEKILSVEPDLEKLSFQDTGGQILGVDPFTGQPRAQMGKTQTPDSIASNRISQGNLTLAQQRFQYEKDRNKEQDARATAAPGGEGAEKPLTESQATAALYLGMMDSAERELGKLKPVTPTDVMLARGEGPWVAKPIQNLVASKDAQKYAQASFQWAEAMLRATTGATAPPEEVKRTAATFFPQINDSPEVIKQKEAMRKQMQTLMAIKAGKVGASQARGAVEAQAAVVPQSIAQMSNEAILEALR